MNASTPRSRARRQSQDTLARTAIACNRCRGRKTKCLGVAPYPCMTCENVGADCVYPDQPKRIFVSEKEWNELQAKAEAAESGQSVTSEPLSPPVTEDVGNNEDEWSFSREVLIVGKSGQQRVIGPSHSTHMITELNPASRSSVQFDVSPLTHASLRLRREPDPALPGLPPIGTAKQWYEAQFAYIGSIFSFIQPKYFEDRLHQVYDRPPDTSKREDCLMYCQVLLLLAFGQMYSLNQWTSSDGPPGFSYFQAALKLLPDIHEEGSVLFVEVLGLVSYFMQILNRRDAAFLYIGLAVRMAVSLGLHQEVKDTFLDEIDLEHRRRVWWSTYSLDRILCVKSGNPISVANEDIDTNWPSALAGLDSNFAQPRILAHYTQLSQILGKIGEDIYRKRQKSGTTLLLSVQSIMEDLEAWLKDIPAEVKLDFASLHHKVSREAVSTFLHYYQCINMTGRPLLFRVCQKRLEALAAGTAPTNWQEGLNTNVVHVVSNSIAAARTATTVMDAAAKKNLLATYGFMDGEHAFSAALVLVMASVAFPYNDRDANAMELSLSVLRGMANKGNEYIRARHELLVNLRNTLSRQARGKLRAIPEPVRDEDDDMASYIESTEPTKSATDAPGVAAFPHFNDFPFTFNTDEADAFLDEFSTDQQIEMNTSWIQSAFQYEGSADYGQSSI